MMVELREQNQSNQLGLGDRPIVSVVMPCLNEERTVGGCVRQALAAIAKMDVAGEVVVSDNGSTDESVAEAERAGARVVHCPDPGYGNAVRFGVERTCGEFVVMGDSDGSYDFGYLPGFVEPLRKGVDLAMGNRFRGGIRPGAMPWKNRWIGNPVLTFVLNVLFHVRIGDTNCGLRAFSRVAFERMQLESPGMEFASEMVVKAAKCKMRIVEVATTLDRDGRNRQPHLAPWRDGWRNLKFLLMFSPLHLFLIPGTVLALLGLLLLLLPAAGVFRIATLRFDIHWMVLGVLLLVVGVQVVQFGAVARLYMVTHRFPEPDRALDWLRGHLRFEHGLLLGVALLAVGLGIDVWILWEWIQAQFGTLARVRPALVASALIAVGVQFIFFSFCVAIVSPPDTRPRAGGDSRAAPTVGKRRP
jgi:glycosyltransferase involved in cell wall biosynthesis